MPSKTKTKSSTPSRLKETKKPRSTGSKNHFKTSVIARRREAFYTTGKGGVGLLIRFPRLVRHIRRIRKDQNARYVELGGIPEDDEKNHRSVLFKSFSQTVIGAIDAYANRVMEFASEHAESRRHPEKGLKLRASDLEFAIRWIKKISSE